MVESDLLAVGTKLPATREMAAHLGVNRSTVFRAYQELFALGYLESRPGSYTTVRDKPKTTVCEPTRERGLLSWERLSNPQSQMVTDIFRRHMPEHARYRPLREYLAHRMQIHGISVSADEVLITNGSHQGLDLILRLLTRPGSKVVVESPTYGNFLPLLKYFQVEIVEVPLRDGGMDLKQLGNVLRKDKPAFVYTIPNFQNPTGLTSPQAHREMLLRLCEKHRVPLVEDGFEEEMKYCGNVALPIKSMDKHNAMKQHMPDGIAWTKPEGGYTIWGTLGKGVQGDASQASCDGCTRPLFMPQRSGSGRKKSSTSCGSSE